MSKRLKPVLLTQRIVTILLVTAATALWANPLRAQSRPKTDVVILKNGDRITGEIKGLIRGKLALKTDWMGTVDTEWDNIERVKSSFRYTAVLTSGVRPVGSLDSGDEIQTLAVAPDGEDATTISYRRVVEIAPLEESSTLEGLGGSRLQLRPGQYGDPVGPQRSGQSPYHQVHGEH